MSTALPVEVAVGVVFRADGAVLLGQRVPGKPYAGWWEFPGGKLEAGETVAEALARELHEELGLEVRSSSPWIVREFVYPHARVRLHFRRVFDFSGEPRSREGQAFAWLRPDSIDVAPLLPATVPVIAWLGLPQTLCRSAAAALGEERFAAALSRRLRERRVGALLLDEPGLPPPAFERLFHRVLPMCRAHGVRVLVGPAHPASFGRAADGALLSAAALEGASGRPAGRLVGAVAGDRDKLERAAALGLDFALLDAGAAQPPERALEDAPLPIYIEGASSGDCPERARAAGAQGVAVGASFWQHEDEGGTGMDVRSIEAQLAPMFPGLMGVRIEEASPDRVVASMLVRPDLCTAGSTLHGGAFMAFADTLGAVATVLNTAGRRAHHHHRVEDQLHVGRAGRQHGARGVHAAAPGAQHDGLADR